MSEDTAASRGNGKKTQEVDTVVIRFAGDSGDGMQLTGSRFTSEAALYGNDLRTLPDFPAEIRAPAGSLAGVSSFQLSFSEHEVFTPGDALDVLVAMNPAALKTNLGALVKDGMLITNSAQFNGKNLKQAGYTNNPLEDGSLAQYRVYAVDISKLVETALADLGLPPRTMDRSKNFFALGLVLWLYNRSLARTLAWVDKKFRDEPPLAEANRRALKAGYFYGETTELFDVRFQVKPAKSEPGLYRNIAGNSAMCLGLVAAGQKSGLELFLGSYPITPASTILHDLSAFKHFGVTTFQAEDEIAAITSAIGASFGGALGCTATSGPGLALKGEALNLAVMAELPLIVIDVQRAGPSTGMPTKTEQADLLQALFGRNSESPVPVLAAKTPSDCFEVAFEAFRIAIKYMTPVLVLTDGYIANGSEPWRVPDVNALPAIPVSWRTEAAGFAPYLRDPETLARPWVKPGTPGLEHRIGGLEKEHVTGSVSYDPLNHEMMVRLRADKVARIAREIPATAVHGDSKGDLLLIGWGSTYGAIHGAVNSLRERGKKVSAIHLRWLNPLPDDLTRLVAGFKEIAVPELNLGQLSWLLRARTLRDVKSITKVQGQPFQEREIVDKASEILDGRYTSPFVSEMAEKLKAVAPVYAEARGG